MTDLKFLSHSGSQKLFLLVTENEKKVFHQELIPLVKDSVVASPVFHFVVDKCIKKYVQLFEFFWWKILEENEYCTFKMISFLVVNLSLRGKNTAMLSSKC